MRAAKSESLIFIGLLFNCLEVIFSANTVPCALVNISIEEDEPGHLLVSWSSVNFGYYYVVYVKSDDGLEVHCNTSHTQCHFQSDRGFTYVISVFPYDKAGQSPLGDVFNYATAPCCPSDLILTQVTQSVTNISWSVGMGAQTYITTLESPKGQVKCHTLQNYCFLGCIMCSTNYTVSLKAISERGLTSSCTYQGYSSSACCPYGVKLYQLGNNGIRVYWQASDEKINYSTDLHGSKGNFTCSPSSGLSHCNITEIPCGDVYTVVVSPVTDKGPKLTFCAKKIYSGHKLNPLQSYCYLTGLCSCIAWTTFYRLRLFSGFQPKVTCSGSSVRMVIHRGKSNAEQHI